MTLSLEDAKAAALASLELDTPDDQHKPASPPPSTSAPASSEPVTYSYDPDHPPHVPSPSLILSIPTPHIIRILSHFDEWFQERTETYEEAVSFVPSTIFAPPALRRKTASTSATPKPAPKPSPPARPTPRPPLPTSHEAHWILSLLARCESLLAGDDISSLRILIRTLLGLVEESDKQVEVREAARVGGRSMAERERDEQDAEGRAHAWMIVAAVAEGWAQRDLWNGD